jgi:hypothetical protein
MKFRLQCSGCNATFFSTDRRSRYCPKCVNKGAGKPAPAETKPSSGVKKFAERFGLKLGGQSPKRSDAPKPGKRLAPKLNKANVQRPAKVKELTPELREQIAQAYQQEIASGEVPLPEAIVRVSDKLWVARKAVGSVLGKVVHPDVPITPEMKQRAIEMYSGYVARGERPPGGRRGTIAKELGVPFRQVRDIVYEWAQTQYAKSPTAELSRGQRFEVEKLYWDELDKQRYSLAEIPEKIAEQLGYTNAFQVARWFDTLHDDESTFAKVADVPPEIEQRIVAMYQQYVAAPKPPKEGLHFTIATEIGGISQRQVHKVLQRYRNRRRDEYPLK